MNSNADNKNKIINTARSLFMDKGIKNTSVEDIIIKSGVPSFTFYNHFDNVAEIADFIYFQVMKKFYATGFDEQSYVGYKNGYEKIKHYYTTIVERFLELKIEINFLVHYNYYFKDGPANKTVVEMYQGMDILPPDSIYREGIKDGSIKKIHPDSNLIFYLIDQSLGSLGHRLIYREVNNSRTLTPIKTDHLMVLLDIFLNAIKA